MCELYFVDSEQLCELDIMDLNKCANYILWTINKCANYILWTVNKRVNEKRGNSTKTRFSNSCMNKNKIRIREDN